MFTIRKLVKKMGDPIRAEAVLLHHYTAKQTARKRWDRRYAAMQFVLKYATAFRRHAKAA